MDDAPENKYLTNFIDILFALIVGYAAHVFTENFLAPEHPLKPKDIGAFLLFLSALAMVIYDWVVYHILIRELPYNIRSNFRRFLLDIFFFSLMYLFFYTVLKNMLCYIFLISIASLILTIWHSFAYEQVIESESPYCEKKRLIEICLKGTNDHSKRFVVSFWAYLILKFILPGWVSSPRTQIFVGLTIIISCYRRYRTVLKA